MEVVVESGTTEDKIVPGVKVYKILEVTDSTE